MDDYTVLFAHTKTYQFMRVFVNSSKDYQNDSVQGVLQINQY